MYKNIEKQVKLNLSEQVDYQPGQVVSKTLVQNGPVSITLFAFDKDEEISTHESSGDAMVTVLEGTGRFTVGGEVYILEKGITSCRVRSIELQDAVGCIILTIEKLAFDIYEINILQALCPAKFTMAYWCKVCYNLCARVR